jgi:hypothetical protein
LCLTSPQLSPGRLIPLLACPVIVWGADEVMRYVLWKRARGD